MEQLPTKPSKGRNQLNYRGIKCLNCGHDLDVSDKYCPNCSQINSTKKTSLRDFVGEFFGSIISYDSRLAKTLTAMLLYPGRITKDYIKGKRVTYTNPFRFLLSLAIIYFLAVSYTQDFTSSNRTDDLVEIDELNYDNNESSSEQAQALQETDSVIKARSSSKFSASKDSLILVNPTSYFSTFKEKTYLDQFFLKTDYFVILLVNKRIFSFDKAKEEFNIPETFQNRKSFELAKSFLRIKNDPRSFINFLLAKMPFLIFFFLPMFSLFIWLIFIRKKYDYIEHLIFSFHIQSLLFILLLFSLIIDVIFKTDTGWIFLFVFAIYLFKAMRNFYGQGRIKTFVKYLILNTVFIILATFSFSILILLTGTIFTY